MDWTMEQINQVIAAGPYRDDWDSLLSHPAPEWFTKAKFGIFIHWGVYSVPAFGSEWYPRNMYLQGSPEFEHHVKTYGSPVCGPRGRASRRIPDVQERYFPLERR